LKWLNDGNFYRTQEADIGKAYRRRQFMFCKPLLRVWRMSYKGQMQRTEVFSCCISWYV